MSLKFRDLNEKLFILYHYFNNISLLQRNIIISMCLQIFTNRCFIIQGIFMLLSSVASSIISPSAVSSSAISMTTSPGLPQYSALVIAGLFILYSLREILSSSEIWNKYLNNSFNLAIIPLVLCFAMIVAYKAMEII